MTPTRIFLLLLITLIAITSCAHKKKIYVSDCNEEPEFSKVKFADLINNPAAYNEKYIEVTGKFIGDRNLTALESDSLPHGTAKQELWINFTPECPLVIQGTHTGFFETEEGHYAKINGRLMTIRCRVDAQKHNMHNSFAAILNDISYLEVK